MKCINKFFSAAVLTLSIFIFGGFVSAQVGAIGSIDEQPAGGGMAQSAGEASVRNPRPSAPRNISPTPSKNSRNKSRKSAKPKIHKDKALSSPAKPAPAAKRQTYESLPIAGTKYSFLNNEIAVPVQPVHRIAAKEAGASGLVRVEVWIGPNGNVLSAKAVSGNALLHPEAERAALATKFNKPTIYGKPARGFGFVVYRFGPEEP